MPPHYLHIFCTLFTLQVVGVELTDTFGAKVLRSAFDRGPWSVWQNLPKPVKRCIAQCARNPTLNQAYARKANPCKQSCTFTHNALAKTHEFNDPLLHCASASLVRIARDLARVGAHNKSATDAKWPKFGDNQVSAKCKRESIDVRLRVTMYPPANYLTAH